MTATLPEQSKIIVVCADRDNDIGLKAHVPTPIVGREACLEAAMKMALADPEEADANTLFAAVKLLDELSAKGYRCQVAAVAGLPSGGFEADQKIRRDLETVVKAYGPKGAVLVSDGAEDERILPIMQNIVPVVSVHRVIIKHSRSVEESYVVLGRYLKMLVLDPRFSKWFLGVPAIILLTSGLLVYFNLGREASVVFAVILGVALLIRAFDVDRMLSAVTTLKPSGYIRLFSIMASILIILASIVQAYGELAQLPQFHGLLRDPSSILQTGPYLVGAFLGEVIIFLWIGLGVFFGGNLLYHFLRRSVLALRSVVAFVILGLLYLPFQQFALILQGIGSPPLLISFVLFGLAITFLVVGLIIRYLAKRRRPQV